MTAGASARVAREMALHKPVMPSCASSWLVPSACLLLVHFIEGHLNLVKWLISPRLLTGGNHALNHCVTPEIRPVPSIQQAFQSSEQWYCSTKEQGRVGQTPLCLPSPLRTSVSRWKQCSGCKSSFKTFRTCSCSHENTMNLEWHWVLLEQPCSHTKKLRSSLYKWKWQFLSPCLLFFDS